MARAVAMSGLEAQHVIGLRLRKMAAGGPAAQTEAQLMVTEKLQAASQAMATLAAGGSPLRVVHRYRTIMRANARRLGRP